MPGVKFKFLSLELFPTSYHLFATMDKEIKRIIILIQTTIVTFNLVVRIDNQYVCLAS